jgi:hypothetical protein
VIAVHDLANADVFIGDELPMKLLQKTGSALDAKFGERNRYCRAATRMRMRT